MKTYPLFIVFTLLLLTGLNFDLRAQQLPLILEAEDAKFTGSGPVISTNKDWPAGEKYVENIHSGSALEYHDISMEKGGVYKFDIYYLSASTDRPLAVTINEYDPVYVYLTEASQHWNSPPTKKITVYVHFDQGKNSIRITPIKEYGPNIDKFIINPADKTAETNVYPYDFTDDAEITATDPNQTLSNLTDNNYNTVYTVNGKTSTAITIDCKYPVLLTGYLLSAGKNDTQDVNAWKLEYSTDNKTWKTITPTSLTKNDYSSTFHINRNTQKAEENIARYYRLTATGKTNINIAELQLFGIPFSSDGTPFLTDIMSEVPVNDHTGGMPEGVEGSTFLNLFDRSISTKYYGLSAETFIVTAETGQAKKLEYYTLTNCADALDRDLKSWKVEGYNGYTWEQVDRVKDFLFPCRLSTMKFKTNTSKGYQAFRLRMESTTASSNFQLLQWQLFGQNAEIKAITQTPWQKKKSSITTPWYDTIDPDNVLGEYPRPQMIRNYWMNLNGIWDFKEIVSMGKYVANQSFDKKVLVPFPIESALSGLMLTDHTERPYRTYLYNRTFTVPSSMKGQNILLHFGAVDWKCEVYVNGQVVGTHEGGYDPFYFDITSALKPQGEQELQVQFIDPTDAGGQPVGKQKIHHGGIFYTPSSGIWQTVWIEGVNENYINDFVITPDIDKNIVKFNVKGVNANNARLTIRVYDHAKKIAETEGNVDQDISLSISNPKLWSPDSPFLYDVEIELKKDGQTTDLVKSYFGMRKISMGQVNGKACFMLNNKPVFQQGPLDQGFWPEGLHTAPSDEALIFDIEQTKSFGFNMSRKHIKVEPARWYYHCDRLGLLVWQDMVNAGSDQNLLGDDTWVKNNFIRESKNIINSLKNHPCIVSWIAFNEGFGQYANDDTHTRNAYMAIRDMDQTRIISSASGWVIFNIGQVADMHSYPRPGMFPNPTPNRISVCGEYGGITLVIKDHVWKDSDMVYVAVNNGEELKDLFINYQDLLRPMQSDGLGAAVYTQLTDLEGEVNGLITYDRKVVKVNNQQKDEIRRTIGNIQDNSSLEVIPTAMRAKNTLWKYTTSTPADNWNTLGFNDGPWASGVSGFGAGNPPNTSYDNKSTVNTVWNTNIIFLRKTFRLEDLTADIRNNFRLIIYYDEDCEVYINGVLAFSAKGYISNYKMVDISDEAKAALRPNGNNVLAIKCKQTGGGQYIDAGLIYTLNNPTGITANYNDKGRLFSIYPNPTEGNCYIKSDIDEIIKSVKIFDMSGNKKKEFCSDYFDISDLTEGIYLVHVLTHNSSYPIKLIKY